MEKESFLMNEGKKTSRKCLDGSLFFFDNEHRALYRFLTSHHFQMHSLELQLDVDFGLSVYMQNHAFFQFSNFHLIVSVH